MLKKGLLVICQQTMVEHKRSLPWERYVLYIIGMYLWISQPVAAQAPEEFRTGKLENGLTYYLRHTGLQPGKADFYLVQNVGALMEDDSQNGLAHFLEHMAFHATETFPQGIDRFMQMHSETEYNAYTAQNETVYSLQNINVKNPGFADSCMLVLRDWCHFLLLPEEDIRKERGVITEEWRMRSNPVQRVRDVVSRALFAGSKYAVRDAIGNMEIIRNFKREELVRYYNDWYRPELQAVIVVGDVDVVRMEQMVWREFARIPVTENPRVRENFTIPDQEHPLYCPVVEPGLEDVNIELLQRIDRPVYSADRKEQVKRMIVRQFYNDMMAARLDRLMNAEETNVLSAAVAYEELVRGYDCHTISLTPYPQQDFRALTEVLEAVEKVFRYGFTAYEFDRQRDRLLRQIAVFDKNLDKLTNNVFVSAYRYHFLEGVPLIEPEERNRLTRECLEQMTVEEVNRWVQSWCKSRKNQVFVVAGPQKEYAYLTEEDISGAWEDIRDADLETEVFQVDTLPLIDFQIVSGRIVKERHLPVGDAREWKMSNGATVIYKPINEGIERVEVLAQSYGGLSLVAAADLPSANAINALAFTSGLYNLDANRLQEILHDREQTLSISLQELGEMIQGKTTTAEVRSLFELLYLTFTHPRFEEAEFTRYVNELKLSLEGSRTPLEVVTDSIQRLFTKESPRIWNFDSAYIGAIHLAKVKSIYNERFSDASDFVFYIVGDLQESEARDLACRYIGSLPSLHREEKYAVHRKNRKFGQVRKDYTAELAAGKALIDLTYQGDLCLNRQEAVTLWMFGAILKSRCMEEIREKRGSTYHIEVATTYSDAPVCSESLNVNFQTEKNKADELRLWLEQEIAGMAAGSVSEEDIRSIAEAQKQMIISRQKGIAYWTDALRTWYDKKEDKTSPAYHEVVLDAITPASMSKLMKKFLKKAQVADIAVKALDE